MADEEKHTHVFAHWHEEKRGYLCECGAIWTENAVEEFTPTMVRVMMARLVTTEKQRDEAQAEVARLEAGLVQASTEAAAIAHREYGETIDQLRDEVEHLRIEHGKELQKAKHWALETTRAQHALTEALEAWVTCPACTETWRRQDGITTHRNICAERDEALATSERRRQDREDALNVKSKEGLTCSEWILRTGQAERKYNKLDSKAGKLRGSLLLAQQILREWVGLEDYNDYSEPIGDRTLLLLETIDDVLTEKGES